MEQDDQRNIPSPDERRGQDPAQPTATAPDSVDRSVPTADDAGKTGPDAADPPRTAGKHEQEQGSGDGGADAEPELDADEGADAFETPEEADSGAYTGGPERRDEDQITLDTPD